VSEADGLDLLWCTFPDGVSATAAARQLVSEGLVACAQVLPAMTSHYRWQGGVEESSEVPILCKLAHGNGPTVAARLEQLHSYDLPAICWWDAGCAPPLAAWARGA
jgi:periplasmic divalent cation tolerance protein